MTFSLKNIVSKIDNAGTVHEIKRGDNALKRMRLEQLEDRRLLTAAGVELTTPPEPAEQVWVSAPVNAELEPVDLGGLVSAESDAELQKLAKPTVGFEQTLQGLKISWSEVPNAVGYKLSFKSAAADADDPWIVYDNMQTTSGTLKGLESGVEYVFRVSAKGDGVNYADSDNVITTVQFLPNADAELIKLPKTTIAAEQTTQGLRVSWTAVPNAAGYKLSFKPVDSDSPWIVYDNIQTTSGTFKALESGVEYVFRVSAKGDGVNYSNSDNAVTTARFLSNAAVDLTKLTKTTILSEQTENGLRISWTAVPNASGYKLSFKPLGSDSPWVVYDNIQTTSGTLRALESGVEYVVRVSAKGDGVKYADSDNAVTIVRPLDNADADPIKLTTTTIASEQTENGLRVSWTAVPNASGYKLSFRALNADADDPWIVYDDLKTTSGVFRNLDPNVEYVFRVRAKGDGVSYADSDNVVTIAELVFDGPAELKQTSASASRAAISWDAVENAEEYLVYVWNAERTEQVYSTRVAASDRGVELEGLDPETAYSVDVIPYSEAYGRGSVSTIEIATGVKKKLAKLVVDAQPGKDDSLELRWNAEPEAAGYRVQYKLVGSTGGYTDFAYLNGADNTACTIPNLGWGTEYSVRVKAIAAEDDPDYYNSDYSAVSVKTADPYQIAPASELKKLLKPVVEVEVEADALNAAWAPVANAAGYRVQYCPAGSNAPFAQFETINTSVAITGLEPNTPYQVRVKALVNNDDPKYANSDYSSVVATTAELDPLAAAFAQLQFDDLLF